MNIHFLRFWGRLLSLPKLLNSLLLRAKATSLRAFLDLLGHLDWSFHLSIVLYLSSSFFCNKWCLHSFMLNLVMTRWQNVDGPFLFQFVLFFFVTMEGRKEGFGLWFWCLLPRWSPGLVSWIVIHGVHAAAVRHIFQLCSVICCCESFSLHLFHFGISVHVKMSMNGAFLCFFTSAEFLFSLADIHGSFLLCIASLILLEVPEVPRVPCEVKTQLPTTRGLNHLPYLSSSTIILLTTDTTYVHVTCTEAILVLWHKTYHIFWRESTSGRHQ